MIDSRYIRIAGVSAVLLAGVFALGTAARRHTPADAPALLAVPGPGALPGEAGMFRFPELADEGAAAAGEKNTTRTLRAFYGRRAYPGAPPIIPHEVAEEGSGSCLGCHRSGGWAPPFKAWTPVTPHPELADCRQCHVPQNVQTAFKATNWQRPAAPAIGERAFPGSPPVIPHQLQMRENCLGCHAGPGAVAEIRTTHPERVNCRQCHAEAAAPAAAFRRDPK